MSIYATTGRLGRLAIAKESAYGTYQTPTQQLSIIKEDLALKVEKAVDPRLIASLTDVDLIRTGLSVEGSLDMTPHPEEVGPLLNLALMKNATPTTAPDAYLLISYVGANVYSSVTLTGTTMTGKSGATQGGAATEWTFDISTGPYDTVAELAAAITVVAGNYWFGYALGYQSSPYTKLSAFIETALNGNMLICAYVGATAKKSHYVSPAGAADAEVSFSACIDRVLGSGKAFGVSGIKVDSLEIGLTPRQIASLTMKVLGKMETLNETYPSVSSLVDIPYVTGQARIWLGGLEIQTAKDWKIALANALAKDGQVGSMYFQEPIRQALNIDISGTFNMNYTQWSTYYPNYNGDTPMEMMVYMENVGYADKTNNVKESILIRVPFIKFKTDGYKTVLSGPNRITTAVIGQGLKQGTTYDQIGIYVVDLATSAY